MIGTDGIWEARNPQREMFGKQRLMDLIRAMAEHDAKTIADEIEKAVCAHLGSNQFQDDVTFVVVKFVPETVSPRSDSRRAPGERLSETV